MSGAVERAVIDAARQWGDDTIGRWRLQMLEYGLGERTGRLKQSLAHSEEIHGGDLHVTVTLLLYGMMADWGVGRGRKLRRGGGLNPGRRPIPWRSARWGIQRYILSRVIAHRLRTAARQLFEYAGQADDGDGTPWEFA